MTALIAAFGIKALAYAATAIVALGGMFLMGRQIKASGAADQRAINAQEELKDATAASKARSTVDGLGSNAVDDRLRQFQRK